MSIAKWLLAKKLSGGGSPFPPVIKRVTGNPIEFSDGADAPLVKCVTAITGYQSGSGTPSPDNIRPIVAYTEGEIVSAGKNLFDNTRIVNKYFSPSTGEVSAQGGWTMSGKVYVDGNKAYYYYVSESPGNSIIGCWDASDNYLGYVYYAAGSASFTTLPNTRYIIFEYIGTVTNISVNVDSTDTSFNDYATTHTATFSSSIYQGNADFIGSSVEGVRKYIDPNITSISRGSLDSSGLLYRVYNNSDIKVGNNQNPVFLICNKYEVTTLGQCRDNARLGIKSCCSYGSTIYIGGYVGSESDLDTELLTIQFAYEVATPTTETITPTNLPLKSLFGYNHIESSTGDMVVDYITEGYQNFVDTVESALPSNTRNLLNASKGGTKAMDIFLSLEKRDDKEEEVKEETKDDMR
jgi:hypothetical protein